MDQQKIDILISSSVWDPEPWVNGLSQSPLVGKIHVWPTNDDLSNVEALFVWKPLDEGVVDKLPKLRWISSLGAGVDHLTPDPQMPCGIPITRIVDPFLSRDMTNFVVMGVIRHQRSMTTHAKNQANSVWDRIKYKPMKVGVMGLGVLGTHLAKTLVQLGFEVGGYSRTQKQLEGVQCYAEGERKAFLSDLDILVNLLPVTPATENVLNKELFGQMKKSAYLINVARGNHLVEEDLINALNSSHLSGALLDVFREEPLPSNSELWKHPLITITPHVASVTTPESAIQLLLENTKRLLDGEELLYQINGQLGY